MKMFKVPLGESNIEWEKETEESLYDRLAYNIHMPQVISMLKYSYDDDDDDDWLAYYTHMP